jgi:hypothetical protein
MPAAGRDVRRDDASILHIGHSTRAMAEFVDLLNDAGANPSYGKAM